MIEVPLPSNTAREVVDVSSKDKVELDTRAKLFSCVSYRVASDWMRLADGLYDKILTEGLSVDEVLATIDVTNENRLRLRESLAAVAVGRSHPTPVSHPMTLRTVASEALGQDADADLVAVVEQMMESVADTRERRAEWNSREASASVFGDIDDDGEFWTEHENGFVSDDEGNHWVVDEAEPAPEYYGDDQDYDGEFDVPIADSEPASSPLAGTPDAAGVGDASETPRQIPRWFLLQKCRWSVGGGFRPATCAEDHGKLPRLDH